MADNDTGLGSVAPGTTPIEAEAAQLAAIEENRRRSNKSLQSTTTKLRNAMGQSVTDGFLAPSSSAAIRARKINNRLTAHELVGDVIEDATDSPTVFFKNSLKEWMSFAAHNRLSQEVILPVLESILVDPALEDGILNWGDVAKFLKAISYAFLDGQTAKLAHHSAKRIASANVVEYGQDAIKKLSPEKQHAMLAAIDSYSKMVVDKMSQVEGGASLDDLGRKMVADEISYWTGVRIGEKMDAQGMAGNLDLTTLKGLMGFHNGIFNDVYPFVIEGKENKSSSYWCDMVKGTAKKEAQVPAAANNTAHYGTGSATEKIVSSRAKGAAARDAGKGAA